MAYKKTVLLSLLIASATLPRQAVASPGSDLLKFGSGILAGLALGYFYFTKKSNQTIRKLEEEKNSISEKNTELTQKAQEHKCPVSNNSELVEKISILEQENQQLKEQKQEHNSLSENNSNSSGSDDERESIEEKAETPSELKQQIQRLTEDSAALKNKISTYVKAQKELLPQTLFRKKEHAEKFFSAFAALSNENIQEMYGYNDWYYTAIVEKK